MRQNADALFCADMSKGARVAAVPKSPKDKKVRTGSPGLPDILLLH